MELPKFAAGVLSFLLPGLGQAAQGYPKRAFFLALGVVGWRWLVLQIAPLLPPSSLWLVGWGLQYLAVPLLVAWDAGRLTPLPASTGHRALHILIAGSALILGHLSADLALKTGHSWGRTYSIPSESTIPTLLVGDTIITDCRPSQGVQRGDVVVFHPPTKYNGDKTDLVKRVVALGGDTVEIKDGAFWLNGERQAEPYTLEPAELTYEAHKVADNCLFVLGDNRNNSHDSRFFGDVPSENWVGRVAWICYAKDVRRIGSATHLTRK